jgi:hypothetical protein
MVASPIPYLGSPIPTDEGASSGESSSFSLLGAGWELQLPVIPPHPGQHGLAELQGVSCPTATVCIATGSASDPAQGALPLAERAELHRMTDEAREAR